MMQMLGKPQFSETEEFSSCSIYQPFAPENTDSIKKKSAFNLLFSKRMGKRSIYKSHIQREAASSFFCLKYKYYFYSPPSLLLQQYLVLTYSSQVPRLWQKQSQNYIPYSLGKPTHAPLPRFSYAHTHTEHSCSTVGQQRNFNASPIEKGEEMSRNPASPPCQLD